MIGGFSSHPPSLLSSLEVAISHLFDVLPLEALGVIFPSYEQLCGNILEFFFFNSHHLVLLGFNNVQPQVGEL